MYLVGIKRNGDTSFVLKRGGENNDEVRESKRKVENTKQLPDRGEKSHEMASHDIELPVSSSSSSSSSFSSSRR